MKISLQGLLGFEVANTGSDAQTTEFYAALRLYQATLTPLNRPRSEGIPTLFLWIKHTLAHLT